MSDLIDRDGACKTLMDDCHIKIMSGNNWIRLEEAVARLAGLPTIEERKTGKWLKAYGDHEAFGVRLFYRYCSECNESTVWAYNFCPNCGADMRGYDHETD